MDAPSEPPKPDLELGLHAGARQDLWDKTLRLEAGVAFRLGWLGAELQGCRRVPVENRLEGQTAALLFTDAPPYYREVLRDDLATAGLLLTVVPAPLAAVGPDFAIGPEVGWTAYRVLDPSSPSRWAWGRPCGEPRRLSRASVAPRRRSRSTRRWSSERAGPGSTRRGRSTGRGG